MNRITGTMPGYVSCITIFLNESRFLEEAVESILAQTYLEWELILVDDGSSDGSSYIARDYSDKHPDRIRYLEHPNHENRGMSASRNLGIEHAIGEYIAFLDADDVWLPQKLEQQVQCLENHQNAAMVYGKTLYWYSWASTKEVLRDDYFSILGATPYTKIQPPYLLTRFLRSEGGPTINSILVRRQVVDTVGRFEQEFREMCEDQVFLAKIFLNYPVFVSGDNSDKYRQHSDSCTAKILNNPGQDFKAWECYLIWLEAYLLHIDCRDPEVTTIVQEELANYRNPYLRKRAVMSVRFKHYYKRIISKCPHQQWLRDFKLWWMSRFQRDYP